jgi:cellulose synthase/poly-beta-1,6-N-acetylglucosamine synthase-like glycosyltransferase
LDFISILDRLALWSLLAIAVIWLAYPAVIAVLATLVRLVRRPARSAPLPDSVTIVVASREPAEALRQRIVNLLDTRWPEAKLDVVVGVHESVRTDIAAAFAGEPRVRIASSEARGKPASLNAAVAVATGDILVFADTYQAFDADTIPNLVSAFADRRVGAVSGRLELPAGTRAIVAAYWSMERALRENEATIHSSIGVTGAVYAMRRSLWHPLPPALLLDDLYGPMRLVLEGHRVAFRPDARAREVRAVEPVREYRRKVRTLTGVLQLCTWMPATLLPIRNPVWIQFTFHKLLRLLTPHLLLLIMAWAAARAFTLPGSILFALVAVVSVAGVWLIRTRKPLGTRLRSFATEGILLQAATLVAGFNGLRGKWQVWD